MPKKKLDEIGVDSVKTDSLKPGKGITLQERAFLCENDYGVHTSDDGNHITFSFRNYVDLNFPIPGVAWGTGAVAKKYNQKKEVVEEMTGDVEVTFQNVGTMKITFELAYLDTLEKYLELAREYVRLKHKDL